MTVTLEGVRQDDWAARAGLARLTARSLARKGQVGYRVAALPGPEAPHSGASAEKRTSERRRSRLRSAKLLDLNNRFICECLVHDRSSSGLCLKLMRNIGLPGRCRLYDDETGEVLVVSTVWRRGEMLGLRFCATTEPAPIKESLRAALRGRYYAIPD